MRRRRARAPRGTSARRCRSRGRCTPSWPARADRRAVRPRSPRWRARRRARGPRGVSGRRARSRRSRFQDDVGDAQRLTGDDAYGAFPSHVARSNHPNDMRTCREVEVCARSVADRCAVDRDLAPRRGVDEELGAAGCGGCRSRRCIGRGSRRSRRRTRRCRSGGPRRAGRRDARFRARPTGRGAARIDS